MDSNLRLPTSEHELVAQAIQRDRTAFTALYERCVDQVYRHVYYRVSSHSDAEDITQEVFVRAWKAIHKYKSSGTPFVAWLITIAGNLIIDHYRRQHKAVMTNEIPENQPDQQTLEPEKQAEVDFNKAIIKKAVLKLKGDKQRVILMHFIDGLSYEEVAKALNKSEGAVRVIQYRALSDLRRWLKRE
jgi:RNA polymerase sigma-70 factor (ECF subfamily)